MKWIQNYKYIEVVIVIMQRYKSVNTGSRTSSFRYRGTRTAVNTSGVYCSICGKKMIRTENNQYMCPECNSWTMPVNESVF